MGTPLRVLLAEDSEDDAELLLRELRQGGFEPAAERVETEEAMCAALGRQPWDLIIADYALPHFSAPAALAVLRDTKLDVPFLIVSGQIGEETAVAMMKAGAHDYIMKHHLPRFLPAVQRELRDAEVRRARKRAEEALRESEEKYRQLFAAESDAVAIFDAETRQFVDVNQAGLDLYGYTLDEFLELRFPDIAADPATCDGAIEQTLEGKLSRVALGYHTKKDGTVFPVEISTGTFLWRGRRMLCGIARDITERKRLEKEVLEISDAERRRLGQELHDGVSQQLTGIRFMASALAHKLAAGSAPEAEDAQAITRLLGETSEQTRALARGMCPLELAVGEVVPALQELALRAQERFGISCHVQCEDPAPGVGDEVATHLHHIAQEAVANAVKHGKAEHVEITLATEGGRIVMTVKDDGGGLPDDADGLKGLGLRIMRYRADVMGASLDVRRRAEGGTLVVCSIPPSG